MTFYGSSLDKSDPKRWNWFGRAEFAYKSKQYQGQDGIFWIPASYMMNLRAGVERGNLRVTLWLDNALNFRGALSAGGNLRLTDFVFEQIATYGPERTFGATVGYKF